MKKKGSHVEVVLSFVIFIMFLIFLYPILIEPSIKTEKNKDYILEELRNKVIENISSNVTVISLNSGSAPGSCINLHNFSNTALIDSKAIAKDYNGNSQTVTINGTSLQISRTNSSETFFRIYNSEMFSNTSSTPISPCTTVNYTFGLKKEKNYVFDEHVSNLSITYLSDYENLKKNLKFPNDDEFDFIFTYSNGQTIGFKKNVTINIFAKENSLEYFDDEGNILLGKLNVRVW